MKKKCELGFGDIIRFINDKSGNHNQIGGMLGKSLYLAWSNDYNWLSSNENDVDFEYLGFDENILSLETAEVGKYYYVLDGNEDYLNDKYELIEIDYQDEENAFKMKCNTDKERRDIGDDCFYTRLISKKQGFNYQSTVDVESGGMVNTNSIISFTDDDDDDDSVYLAPQPKAIV